MGKIGVLLSIRILDFFRRSSKYSSHMEGILLLAR